MPGSPCAECLEGTDSCSTDSAFSKTSPPSTDACTDVPVSAAAAVPAHKGPIKLDIAAILAADSGPAEDVQSGDSAPAAASLKAAAPETVPASGIQEPVPEAPAAGDESAADSDVSGQSGHAVTPAMILLIILCILLGLGILCTMILIIWPNIIPVLFYHRQI